MMLLRRGENRRHKDLVIAMELNDLALNVVEFLSYEGGIGSEGLQDVQCITFGISGHRITLAHGNK